MNLAGGAARASTWRQPISTAMDWLVLGIASPLVVLQRLNLRRILLAVVLLELPVQVDVYLNYRDEIAAYNGIGGFNVSLTTALMCALYVLWALDLFSRRTHIERARVWALTPMLLYLGAVGLSALVAYDQQLALYDFNLLSQAMLLAVYVGLNTKTADDVVFVLSLIALGVALQSVLILGLRAIDQTLTIATVKMRIDDSGRVGGTIGSPNGAGSYLSLFLPLCLALAATPVRALVRLTAIAAAALGPIALVSTLSRGSWVALLVSGAFLIVYAAVWNKTVLRRLVPILLIGACLALPLIGEIAARLARDDEGSAESRLPLVALATDIAIDHPLLGVGPNNFVPIMHSYATVEFTGAWLRAVHNKYMLVWSETGTVGLLLFLLSLAYTLRLAFPIAAARHPILSPLGVALAGGLLGHMVHMLVDIFNGRPSTTFLWLVTGMIVAIHSLVSRSGALSALAFPLRPARGRNDVIAW